jgi:hypothetical protein
LLLKVSWNTTKAAKEILAASLSCWIPTQVEFACLHLHEEIIGAILLLVDDTVGLEVANKPNDFSSFAKDFVLVDVPGAIYGLRASNVW